MGLLTGNQSQRYSQYTVDTFVGNGSTTSYNLTRTPVNAASMIVTIDGVKQHVSTYSVSSGQIAFTEAPPSGSSIECITTNSAGITLSPSDASVGTPTIINGAVTAAKYDVANANGTGAMAIPVGTTAQRPGSNVLGHFRHNTDRKAVEFNDGTGWQVVKSLLNTTGGTIIETPAYRLHAFLSSGTFYTDTALNVDVLVVGGGGAGGQGYGDQDTGKGGGGAGGVVYKQGHSVTAGSYPIIVGAGGAGRSHGWNSATTSGMKGDNSVAFGVTANGGGGGGCSDNYAAPTAGGSGGGGGSRNATDSNTQGAASNQSSYAGWISKGNAGGYGGGNGNYGGAGGGGANGIGGGPVVSSNNSTGGNGGAGIDLSSIFGTWFGEAGWFGGGGGGGSYSTSTLLSQSVGGQGGGGNGVSARENSQAAGVFSINRINGLPGTGGGGGGASEDAALKAWWGSCSGSGGSGIVLVKVYL